MLYGQLDCTQHVVGECSKLAVCVYPITFAQPGPFRAATLVQPRQFSAHISIELTSHRCDEN